MQGELFSGVDLSCENQLKKELSLTKEILENWQKKVQTYQSKLFKEKYTDQAQGSFFKRDLRSSVKSLNPLKLTPLPLNFWRWPISTHQGPAIYIVMDKPINLESHLLLYIGETLAADKRWKGEHDCKNYLMAYEEAFKKAGLATQLSIRFWIDVPKDTKPRRKLEQELIQHWLPPFNKETRNRWSTPFTTQTHY